MSITVTSLQTPAAPSPVPLPDDGFGALTTLRGNLPLEALDVRLVTTGLFVRTELAQTFRNPYPEPLEATYVFPLPDRSALTSMRMEADDRVIDGVLREREQARADYDQALSEGKRASIAEEERPGVFTMRVGNIMPGERVTIRLTLAGNLGYEDGAATLRFPLVVAPHYIPGSPLDDHPVGSGVETDTDAVPDASRITPPVLLPGCPSPIDLSIEVDVDPAGLPVVEAESSLHPIAVDDLDGQRFRVRVHPGERADRDFILRLRLGDDHAIRSSLVVVPDATRSAEQDSSEAAKFDVEGSGTFALTLLPPMLADSTRARDVVFVLDRSGSMAGWKMVTARRATARMLDTLTGTDRFAVLAFDHAVETPADLSESLTPATDRSRFRAVEFLAGLDARGGTEMLAPLVRGADLLAEATTADAAHSAIKPTPRAKTNADVAMERDLVLVLVTDGQVGNEDQILAALAPRLAGVRIHTVGIDVAVNEGFLHRIAALGGGHCELVESEDRLDAAMEAIHRRVGAPLVTDLTVAATGLDILSGSLTPKPLPGLYAGAALQLAGRYRGRAQGAVTVTGRAAGGSTWSVELPSVRSDNTGLGGVWARGRLRDLEDRYVIGTGAFDDVDRDANAMERQIVATSLRFGVLCRFTAYVAIDSRVVSEGGTQRHVTQPVDLPQGWDLASPTPVVRAAPAGRKARRRLTAGSGPGFAGAVHQANSLGMPAAPGKMPAAFEGSEFGKAPGAPLWQGSQSDETDVPAGRADLTSGQFEQLGGLRTSLAAEFAQLESVVATDRPRQLKGLGDRLTVLLADIDVPDDVGGLQPLLVLARDLHAFGLLVTPDPVEVDRLWLRVLDVLGAWAGAVGDLWSVGGAPPTGQSTRRPAARDRALPDASSIDKQRRTFWRRTR